MKLIIWIPFWMIFIFQCESSTYRLDRNIVPNSYSLHIYVEENLNYFLGKVIISLKVDKPQTHVSLHFFRIRIISVYLNSSIKCIENEYNQITEIGEFQCNEILKTGDHLNISYKGPLAIHCQKGIFQGTYNNEKIISTMFNPGYARRLFPCFDEPLFKAYFTITVTYPKNYKVLTNTPLNNTITLSNNFKWTSFQTTPKMSTYLVTVVISKFESAFHEDQIGEGYNFNIYTRPGFSQYVGLSMKYGKEIIDAIGSWTQIDYGEMKNKQLYILSMPNLELMAMENWGLIILRDTYLFDEGYKSSTSHNESVINILAHVIALQWFGNYVTAEWWSDIWIRDGIGAYIANHIFSKVLNYTEEDFEREKGFVGNILNNIAFEIDSLPGQNPVCVSEDKIISSDDAEENTNDISLYKGASILRMITYLIGMKAFRQAMTSYLNVRKYSTATTAILLTHLANASEQDPETFATKMNAWIHKAGYPIVTAIWDGTTSEIVLIQKSFHGTKTQWYIPISYTTSSDKNFIFGNYTWLQPNMSIRIPHKNKDWIIFNLDVVGFYRVKYDTYLLNKIIAALKGKDKYCIGSLNKAQLIYDLFSLAEIGQIKYIHVFNLLDYIRHEPDYYPWHAAFSVLSEFFYKIDYETQLLLKERILNYIDEATSDKTNNTFYVNKHINILKKNMMQEWACKLGQKACIEYVKTAFDDYKKFGYLSDYELRDMVFCNALKYSTVILEDYRYLLDVYRTTNSSLEKATIFRSLGCISDSETLRKLLNEVIFHKLEIEGKLILVLFTSIIENDQTGFRFTLDFLEHNIRTLKKYFIIELIDSLHHLHWKLFTEDQKIRVKAIMEKTFNLKPPNMISHIEKNIKWTKEYGQDIKSALEWNYNDLL